jgi:hypothetical protein
VIVVSITILVAVPGNGIYVESQHHRVVLVDRVVAMHRVSPDKVSEAEEQFDVVVLTQPHDVLAAPLDQRRRLPVPSYDLVFFEVNVDRVLPIKATFEVPDLRVVAFHFESDIIARKDFVVDDPLTVLAVELEAPLSVLGLTCRNSIEAGVGRRVYTAIAHSIGSHS